MKRYVKVEESQNCYCHACGKRFDDESMEEKILYDINFVQDYENGNMNSRNFRLCWNCTKDLTVQMEKARYESIRKRVEEQEKYLCQ